ncbi:hypothetical protein DMN57_02170 [Escherichia coli]|nr:hypothetical protein [Escherichia coli]
MRKRIYKTRDLARADIFDYIEVFYNRARRHSHLGGSVRRPLNRPRREDRICLQPWGQSKLPTLWSFQISVSGKHCGTAFTQFRHQLQNNCIISNKAELFKS